MSLFKKPKRNIRRRDFDSNEENEEEGDFKIDGQDSKKNVNVKTNDPKVKKEKKKQAVLSFHEELDEGDDGEIFQVKKSSQSKKIRKLMDKERKKKKDVKSDVNESSNTKENLSEITTIDEITIKIKNNLPINRVLNGREAEMAEIDGVSSEEEDDSGHKFSHPDLVKQMLKKGQIPDAAMIHAARKRRQQAREMGGDYIPIEDSSTKYETSKPSSNSKSRLIREDDNDGSDDEERIKMVVNTAAIDKERRREAFHTALENESEESDHGEEEEWEKQQIRKGVTGAQIAAVQQENMYYAYAMPPEAVGIAMPIEPPLPECVTLPVQVFPPLPMMGTGKVDHVSVAKRIQERLADIKEVSRRHALDRDERAAQLELLRKEIDQLKVEAPGLAERFRFYQDLRGW
uniref:GCF C-terminal domain-containing protein n=1 Tax=Clastoptera arizonana TaxID=38151 RepID=A0A1B6C9W1_9HEMI